MVSRGTVFHASMLDELIAKAILKRGFAVVEVVSHCHTQYGRRNRMGDAVEMLRWQKESAVRVEKAKEMTEEQLRGKFTDRHSGRPGPAGLYPGIRKGAGGGPGHGVGTGETRWEDMKYD